MATTTILFTDSRSSDQSVDGEIPDRLAQHLGRGVDIIEANGGRVAQKFANGVMALFASATEAVLAAIALQQANDRDARLIGGIDGLRVGVDVADIASRSSTDSGDLYRHAATASGRALCHAAATGQILVSDLVRRLVGSRVDLEFIARHSYQPEGSSELIEAWEVGWSPTVAPAISVVVAEDSVFVRAGIVALLREEGFDVRAETGDYEGLLDAARRHRPMLVVTDVRMPPGQGDEGIVAAARLREEDPTVGVLVLSQHIESAAAVLLLENNPTAVGYLLKERVSDLDDFARACRVVAAGGVVIDPLITEHLLQRRPDNLTDRLSERERQVLDLMAQGRSNAAIARAVNCSIKTLETHIRSVFTKLNLPEDPDDHRRVAAVVRYLHNRG
jgi:DNA-binding NarL/FixJ family response regulator